jgi:hypothetical protein
MVVFPSVKRGSKFRGDVGFDLRAELGRRQVVLGILQQEVVTA